MPRMLISIASSNEDQINLLWPEYLTFDLGCRRCEKLCNYSAIKVNEDAIAEVDGLKCKGCGVCVSSCPARAIDLKYYRDLQFVEEIKGICSTELKYRDEFIDTVDLITKPLTPQKI